MSSKKKDEVIDTKEPIIGEESVDNEKNTPITEEKVEEKVETPKKEEPKKTEKKGPKFPVGSIVFISKDADADLNGFKLFPQYKKCTYTVEAYDGHTGIYSLRRLNLSLKLKETEILAPHEKNANPLMQKQY